MSNVNIVHAKGSFRDSRQDIMEDSWYNGKWGFMYEPIDADLAQRAVLIGKMIAANDAFTYSKSSRWTGYNSILKGLNKGKNLTLAISQGSGQFDCSSFVLSCYKLAGIDYHTTNWKGYTGSMDGILRRSLMFKRHKATSDKTEKAYCQTDEFAVEGAIYLKELAHTVLCIGGNDKPVPKPDKSYVEIMCKSINIRQKPSWSSKKIGVATLGQRYDFIEDTGKFYKVVYGEGFGYISHDDETLVKLVVIEG